MCPHQYSVLIQESDNLVSVDSGMLLATLSKHRFNLFHTVRFADVEIIAEHSSPGFAIMTPERKHFVSMRDRQCVLTIEQTNPAEATITVRGKHYSMPGETGSLLDFCTRISFPAGRPNALVDYKLTNNEVSGKVVLRGIGYAFRVALGQVSDGRVWTDSGDFPLTDEGHTLMYETSLTGWHPNWIGWQGPKGGLSLALRHMALNAPTALRIRPTGFSIGYYPEVNDPASPLPYLTLAPGESREYSTLFHFLAPTTTREEVAAQARLFEES